MKTFREHIVESVDISHVRDALPDHFDVSHAPHCDRHSTRGQGRGVKITVNDLADGKSFAEHCKDAVKAVSKTHAHTGVLYKTHSEPSFHMTVWPKHNIAEDTAKDNIHHAIGGDWRYDVTNSPGNDRNHISHGKGHGIKVVVKEPNKEHTAMHHRDEVVKMLKRDGHKVAHGILTDHPNHQEFHLSVFHKK